MNDQEGKRIAQNAMDAIAIAEERSPDGVLIAVQTLLVIRERDGSIRIFGTASDGQLR